MHELRFIRILASGVGIIWVDKEPLQIYRQHACNLVSVFNLLTEVLNEFRSLGRGGSGRISCNFLEGSAVLLLKISLV